MLKLDLRPDRPTLRKFGYVAFVAFGLLSLLARLELGPFGFGLGPSRAWVALGLMGVGALAAFFSLVAPGLNRPLYVGLVLLGSSIGQVVAVLVLGVLYFGLITPLSLIFRVLGRDALERRADPEALTYFRSAMPMPPRERYFRQF
jgi:hypothetical protein